MRNRRVTHLPPMCNPTVTPATSPMRGTSPMQRSGTPSIVRGMNRLRLAVAAVAATALTLPAGAGAATTIGTSPAAALPTSPLFGCAPDPTCTIGQERLSNAEFRVPVVNGADRAVVVAWRIYGQGGQARLRRVGGSATAPLALPAAPDAATAPAQLAVAAGDRLVVDLENGAAISGEPNVIGDSDVVHRWTPALTDGETRAPAAALDAWLFYQADLEPDRDGDGLGDETQDPCVACTTDRPDDRTGRGGGGDTGDDDRGGERSDPYAAIRRNGPRVKISAKATATRAGVAALTLTNPYDFKLTGKVTAKNGRRAAGSARVTLKPGASATVRLKLAGAARTTLTRKRAVKLSLAVSLRAPEGRAGTTRRAVTVKLGAPARRAPSGRGPAGRQPGGGGFDGTYRASNGYVMVVEGGIVKTFSGDITTYCSASKRQKRVAFGMYGDDPNPKVAADGSFTYEATRGYGMVKLRFSGRISGSTAKGRLMVEDRSPLLGTGRIEFDYCFAGDDWELKR